MTGLCQEKGQFKPRVSINKKRKTSLVNKFIAFKKETLSENQSMSKFLSRNIL